MRLFSRSSGSNELFVEGERLYLRSPRLSDYEAWKKLRGESEAFLRPWEPKWHDEELSLNTFKARLRRYSQSQTKRTLYTFLIFDRDSDALIGGITLSQVRRGVSQSCSIGYWTGERFAGKGYMGQALKLALDFAFNRLDLHRVEAACIPHNERSARLLTSAGFTEEGLVREYLRINGKWEDHRLFAILADDFNRKA